MPKKGNPASRVGSTASTAPASVFSIARSRAVRPAAPTMPARKQTASTGPASSAWGLTASATP